MVKNKGNFRIVFVNLKSPLPVMAATSRFTYEYLGIGYLTSVLRREGYFVKIIDAQTRNLSQDKVIREISDFNPAFIGFSPTSITFESAAEIAKVIKQRDNNIHICLGGQLATFAAKEILKNESFFDSVVRGYGEETIVEVVNKLRLSKSLEGVQGVFYEDQSGKIIENKDRPKNSNLDTIPFPARDSLEWQIRNGGPPTARMVISRGCVFGCSFCSTPAFERIQSGLLWSARSPENVLDELRYLKKQFNVTTVLFSDDNFIGPGSYGRERVRKIASGIIEEGLNINFRILCRADALLGNNADLILLLKRAGLERVILGIESSCPSGLKVFNKNASVGQNIEAIKLLLRNNIALEMGFIMFHPYVTFEELRKNALFLKKFNPKASFCRFLSRLALYPGSSLIDRLNQDGLLDQRFDYKSPFRYKFKDPRIGLLVDSLGKLGSWFCYENIEETIYEWENRSLDVYYFLSNTQNKALLRGEHEENRLSELRRNYVGLRNEVNSLNFDFFMKCVESAENQWNDAIFRKLKDKYLQDINNASKKLRGMCKDILRVF